MSNETKLIVDFDLDKLNVLKEWKSIMKDKFGHGGQKRRIQLLIEKDLNTIKDTEDLNGEYNE